MVISDNDFVCSFLKAARERKLSVIVVFGEDGVLKTVSNVGVAGMIPVLQQMRNMPLPTVDVELDAPALITGDA